jgi:RNA polymerase sigma factor (sigma-70 family)
MKHYSWDELTLLAREYLTYLPEGNSPLNRNARQREIFDITINSVRPYLFRIAYSIRNGGLKVRNRTGKYSLLSLKHSDISDDDLVQIGSLCLVENFHKYNPKYRLATFVAYFAAIGMYREGPSGAFFVSLPSGNLSKYKAIIRDSSSEKEAIQKLELRLANHPSIKRPNLTAQMIYSALYKEPLDLFGFIQFDDGEVSLESRIAAEEKSILDLVEEKLLLGRLSEITLTEKERAVIKGFFVDDLTLSEVGKSLGLSRERSRQIRNKVLNRAKEKVGVAVV